MTDVVLIDSVADHRSEHDQFTLHTPRWLNTLVSMIAEVLLVVVTVGIITAMWLPAYLASRQNPSSVPVDRGQEEMIGMFPRGR